MLQQLLFSFWFLLPAGLANVAPIFAAHLPGVRRFNTPIDGGRTWRGQEIFGSHKTWRGLISGLVVSVIIVWIQQIFVTHFGWARWLAGPVDYQTLPTILFGLALGFGALGGDAIKSFFKRRVGVRSGKSWLPFDQLDYVIGASLMSLLFVTLPWYMYVWLVVVWFTMHLLASYIGWLLKLKDEPI